MSLSIVVINSEIKDSLKDIEKFFNNENKIILPKETSNDIKLISSKINPEEERKLKDNIKGLISKVISASKKRAAPANKTISFADKLNILDNFEENSQKIKKSFYKNKKDQQDFEKTKRILLESVSNRKLDLSLRKIYSIL